MTAQTATQPPLTDPSRSGRLRTLLLVDGAGTAALGILALAAAEPLSRAVATPGVLQAVGVLFLVVGADMLLARTWSGRRLSVAARALGAADLAFTAVLLLALPVVDATAAGVALVLAVAAICVGMGLAKLRLAP